MSSIELYSIEAEEALLGSVLINQAVLEDLKQFKASYFYEIRHQWIYEAILSLKYGDAHIDNLTVCEVLKTKGRLKEIGGSSYITYLINQCPTWLNFETYARIIEAAAVRRRLMDIAGQLAQGTLRSDRDTILLLIEQARKLIETPAGCTNPLRAYLYHATELKNLKPITWLIPNELPERGLTVLFGASGVGKSFMALDYALRLAQTIPVLYVASEGEMGLSSRVEAWCAHHKQQEGQLYFFLNVIALLDAKEHEQFTDLIKNISPKLLVIDTLAHCMLPGNENDTRDMGLFLKAAKAIQKEFETAVLLVHHTSKRDDMERGNSALRAAADTMIRMTDDDDAICVECSKSKDAQPFPTRYVRLLPVQISTGSVPVLVEADKIVQSKHDPLTQNQAKVLRSYARDCFAGGASITEIAEDTRLPRGSIYRVVSRLAQLGHLTRSGPQASYVISDQGRTAIDDRTIDSVVSPHDSVIDSVEFDISRRIHAVSVNLRKNGREEYLQDGRDDRVTRDNWPIQPNQTKS